MGSEGHTLVFGGCDLGLMATIGEAVHEAGGTLTGVVPTIIEERGKVFPHCDSVLACNNLSDRKDIILSESDVVVALPGGIGTLDEVFTVAAAHTIGYHGKMVILYNINGFWDPLTNLLDHLQAQKMIRGHWNRFIQVANSLDELKQLLAK